MITIDDLGRYVRIAQNGVRYITSIQPLTADEVREIVYDVRRINNDSDALFIREIVREELETYRKEMFKDFDPTNSGG